MKNEILPDICEDNLQELKSISMSQRYDPIYKDRFVIWDGVSKRGNSRDKELIIVCEKCLQSEDINVAQLCKDGRFRTVKGEFNSGRLGCACSKSSTRILRLLGYDSVLYKSYTRPTGATQTVIEHIRGSKVSVVCSVCHHDDELFKDPCITTITALEDGKSPCMCSNCYRYSQDQYDILIKRVCEKLNNSFFGYVNNCWEGRINTFLKLRCNSCGYYWETTCVNEYLHSGVDCPDCNKRSRTSSQINFGQTCVSKGFKILTEYKCNHSKVLVTCPEGHNNLVTPKYFNKVGGYCNDCGSGNKHIGYVFIIYDSEIPVAIKYGVTSSLDTRTYNLNKSSKFKLSLFKFWCFESSIDCERSESVISKRFNEYRECISKWEQPDGYTETLPIFLLDEVGRVFEEYGGKCD